VALRPQVDLDALRSRLETVARRPALAHEVAHSGEQLTGQLRAAGLEAHPRPREDVELEVHDSPPGVVGLAQSTAALYRLARQPLAAPRRRLRSTRRKTSPGRGRQP
jgi:hypothetical protein